MGILRWQCLILSDGGGWNDVYVLLDTQRLPVLVSLPHPILPRADEIPCPLTRPVLIVLCLIAQGSPVTL